MKRLEAYMKLKQLDDRALAKLMNVSCSTIYSWRKGVSQPGVVNAVKLEKITRDAVSVYDWK
jgi:transcriptional regulator with XRE-family HTH domain